MTIATLHYQLVEEVLWGEPKFFNDFHEKRFVGHVNRDGLILGSQVGGLGDNHRNLEQPLLNWQ